MDISMAVASPLLRSVPLAVQISSLVIATRIAFGVMYALFFIIYSPFPHQAAGTVTVSVSALLIYLFPAVSIT